MDYINQRNTNLPVRYVEEYYHPKRRVFIRFPQPGYNLRKKFRNFGKGVEDFKRREGKVLRSIH